MTTQNEVSSTSIQPVQSRNFLKVSHYGTINIGELSLDCVVLENGERGYIQKQLVQAIGFSEKNRGARFATFLAETAPKALILLEKTDVGVIQLPHGGNANFAPAGILGEIAIGVIESSLAGTLHPHRKILVAPCLAIMKALAKTAELALIDEATGYQYHRESNALQEFINKVIRQECATWERRFHPDYYQAMFRLFGKTYHGQANKPSVIGHITAQWVYEAVFPKEIMDELRQHRESNKMHQWLTSDCGLPLLEKQINAVTMIARSSVDYIDFKTRCGVAFQTKGQKSLIYPQGVN